MELTPISEFSFLVFILPGFLAVLGFYYARELKIEGEFKLIGLSFFWGFITLLLWSLLTKAGLAIDLPLRNSPEQYAAASILSVFGFVVGFLTGKFSQWTVVRKILAFLRSDWSKVKIW